MENYFLVISFERRDLRRAALFLWITLRFAALSSAPNTLSNDFFVGLTRNDLMMLRSFVRTSIVCSVRLRSCRSFFEALAIIGIRSVVYHNYFDFGSRIVR
jgi:hypothetical protein